MAELRPAVMAGGGAELGLRIARIVARTGHLHRVEMARLKDLLGGSSGIRFMQTAAHFADGDRHAFNSMTALLDHAGATSWTAATVLPFLWRPDIHMLLKPESTCNFARWAGHPFATAYVSKRELKVYDGLLDLAAATWREIDHLHPVDQIDIQGFIWVTARYDRDDERPASSSRRPKGTEPDRASPAPD